MSTAIVPSLVIASSRAKAAAQVARVDQAPQRGHVGRREDRLEPVEQGVEPGRDLAWLDRVDPVGGILLRHQAYLGGSTRAMPDDGGTTMADFLAITFDGTDDAEAALKSVRGLEGATGSSSRTRPSSARTPTAR